MSLSLLVITRPGLQGDNTSIPPVADWDLTDGSKFVHYCDNETIQGVEFAAPPAVGDRLLIGDFSSNILSKPVDVSKYGVLYAGAQKNVGPAGVTMVIVRDDLLDSARPTCPTMLSYKTMAETESMYNTPPCWAIYVCGLAFKKLLAEGGLEAMQQRNTDKVRQLPWPLLRAPCRGFCGALVAVAFAALVVALALRLLPWRLCRDSCCCAAAVVAVASPLLLCSCCCGGVLVSAFQLLQHAGGMWPLAAVVWRLKVANLLHLSRGPVTTGGTDLRRHRSVWRLLQLPGG